MLEPHWRPCVMSLSKTLYPHCYILVTTGYGLTMTIVGWLGFPTITWTNIQNRIEERSGSVVKCLTRDQAWGVACLSFTRGTVLCPWARHCPHLSTGSTVRHIPTWLKKCWLGHKDSKQTNKTRFSLKIVSFSLIVTKFQRIRTNAWILWCFIWYTVTTRVSLKFEIKAIEKPGLVLKIYYEIWQTQWYFLLGRVAQLVTYLVTDKSLTADPGVASLILAQSHTFVEIEK